MRLFDEINDLSENGSIDIDQYFDEMELSGEEKEKRKEFAKSMEEVMLFIFALFSIMDEFNYMNRQYIVKQLQDRYSKIVKQYIAIDNTIDAYILEFSEEIVDTTLKYSKKDFIALTDKEILKNKKIKEIIEKNAKEKREDKNKVSQETQGQKNEKPVEVDDFYLSDDRAILVGVNEANSILGYRQLQEAKEKGYTKKMWVTERDNKVRKTHRAVDEKTIDIDSYFLVGDSLMQYPHDMNGSAKETCGCRCTLKFS